MFAQIRCTSRLQTELLVVLLGASICIYWYRVHSDITLKSDGYETAKGPPFPKCTGRGVIRLCRKRQLIKTLFVVDAQPDHITERSLARATYAQPSFAGKFGWLTVFRLVGNTSEHPAGWLRDWMDHECEYSGDIVYQDVTAGPHSLRDVASTFLRFVPWVLKNCRSSDTVVHMGVRVLPVPSNLARYSEVGMNSTKEVVHRFHTENATSGRTAGTIEMAKRTRLEALARNSTELDGRTVMEDLSITNIGGAVVLHEDNNANATFPEALFHVFPKLEGFPILDMMYLWSALGGTSENNSLVKVRRKD